MLDENTIDRLALAIMVTSMRTMRENGIDIGEHGSRKALKVCNAVYLNAKKVLKRPIKN